jgi:hypothetical protein
VRSFVYTRFIESKSALSTPRGSLATRGVLPSAQSQKAAGSG